MINVSTKGFFVDTVAATLTTDGATSDGIVQKRLNDTGFHLIAFRPELYDASGSIISNSSARGLVTVSIEEKASSRTVYTQSAIDIFTLEDIDKGLLWRGWEFGERAELTFRFSKTTIAGAPDGTVNVQLNLVGYRL